MGDNKHQIDHLPTSTVAPWKTQNLDFDPEESQRETLNWLGLNFYQPEEKGAQNINCTEL